MKRDLSQFKLYFEELPKPKFRRIDSWAKEKQRAKWIAQAVRNDSKAIAKSIKKKFKKFVKKIKAKKPNKDAPIHIHFRLGSFELDLKLSWFHVALIVIAAFLLWPTKSIAESTPPSIDQPVIKTIPKAHFKTFKHISELKPIPVPKPTPEPVLTPSVVSGCGDNSYANFIYMHESGCNTKARNAGGCLGIGQACPGSKLLAVCPNLDYACENQFFTAYAKSAYGGWQQAYNAWISKNWW